MISHQMNFVVISPDMDRSKMCTFHVTIILIVLVVSHMSNLKTFVTPKTHRKKWTDERSADDTLTFNSLSEIENRQKPCDIKILNDDREEEDLVTGNLVAIVVDPVTDDEADPVTDVDLVLDPEEVDPVENDDLVNGTNVVVTLPVAVEIVNLVTANLARSHGINHVIELDPGPREEMSNGNAPVQLQEHLEDLLQLPDPPGRDPVKNPDKYISGYLMVAILGSAFLG